MPDDREPRSTNGDPSGRLPSPDPPTGSTGPVASQVQLSMPGIHEVWPPGPTIVSREFTVAQRNVDAFEPGSRGGYPSVDRALAHVLGHDQTGKEQR
jgi:hypothetical protein